MARRRRRGATAHVRASELERGRVLLHRPHLPPAPILPVEVTGYTTPALADIGRASLRVRFTSPDASQHPTGGLILGIRRHPDERFLPTRRRRRAGDRGPDRHGATRESLAELVIMARPLHENEDDASASKSTETTPAGFEPSRAACL